MRILLTVGGCALATIALGTINIWLGVLALPIMYSFARGLLAK